MKYLLPFAIFLIAGCDKKPAPNPEKSPTAAPAQKAAPPPLPEPESPSLAPTEAVQLYESLAEQHARPKGETCATLAERLHTFREQKQSELSLINARTWRGIEQDPELMHRAQSAMEVVITQSMACKNDPAMQLLKSDAASYQPPGAVVP